MRARARAQCLDRYHHAPGEEHAGAEGERERSKEDQTGPLKRGIKRRVGLLDRRFDEHQPTKRSDRRRRGEHLAAFNVLRFLDVLAAAASYLGAGAAHLRKLRHVGIAQYQANVGMRDETAGSVDHVGASMPGEFDLR